MSTRHSNNPDFDLAIDNETEEPKQYQVLLLNDDYSPMDFVIFVLKKFFGKNDTDAYQIMLDVHNKGSGLCGVYTFEVAETKVSQVNQFSKANQHPLTSTLEEI
ncbi:MAG: ATP-dependent Clp protease adapter ClpS [Pseudobdellovibrio sp.]